MESCCKHLDINFLRRNICDCPTRVKEQCYKTLVRPVMDYASCIWDPNTKANIEKIEMVQRRAARFVKGDYDRTSSVTAMLNGLGSETLQQRRQQAKVVMFYRIVHGLVAVQTTPFLIPAAMTGTRGHNMRYLVPQSKVNALLPQQVVSVPSIEAFKLLLQTSTM